MVEHHEDHILVEVGETVARLDDQDVEGLTVLRRRHEDCLIGLEYRNELGVVASLHLTWQSGSPYNVDDYCRRVTESAAINVMHEFGESGLVERSGYRFDDRQIDCYPADDSHIVSWTEVTGIEVISGSIAIWTGDNEHPSVTIPDTAPNNLVLQKLIPPMAAAHGQESSSRQWVGELNGVRQRHYHPVLLLALLAGFMSATLIRRGFNPQAVVASLVCLLCVPLFCWAANRLSKRRAILQLYRDSVVLSIGRSQAVIPWHDLARLAIYNSYRSDGDETSFPRRRRVHFNVPGLRIMREDMHLIVDATGNKLKLVEWIRDRAKRERADRLLDRE